MGVSDGWQELQAHKRLSRTYTRAENGNVAVTGEIDLGSSNGTFVMMALGFGPRRWKRVSTRSLVCSKISTAHRRNTSEPGRPGTRGSRTAYRRSREASLYHTSAAVLRAHESKRVEGGIIASLSIPWGLPPDDDLGGYHLVWPRDLVETAGGFIAIGAHEHVRRVLRYLQVTQEPDGHWSQNMWLDGTPYWHGIQMDETALPILLVDLAASSRRHRQELARFVVADGAASGGISRAPWSRESAGSLGRRAGLLSFTIATEIAALAAAPIWPMRHRTRRQPTICERRPTPGMRASNDGVLLRNGISASARRRRLLRAWRCLIGQMPRPRVMDSCRSRAGLLIKRWTGGVDGQPGRARARALRAARGR